jgi:hypothetical protein
MSNFSGTSKKGDIQDALTQAIETAKAKLTTDLVQWKLVTIEGENGGFVEEANLTVTIDAHVFRK